MWKVSEQHIHIILRGYGLFLSPQELQCSVGSNMDHRVLCLLQIAVKGGVLVMRRNRLVVIILFLLLMESAARLQGNRDISKIHAGKDYLLPHHIDFSRE